MGVGRGVPAGGRHEGHLLGTLSLWNTKLTENTGLSPDAQNPRLLGWDQLVYIVVTELHQ